MGLVAGGWVAEQHRHVPLHDAVNPMFWLRRWRGQDLYDARLRLLYHGSRALPEVALTIDDGPHQPGDARLLEVLREYRVRATFFVIGENIKQHPAIVRRMLAEGHEVGNHTQTHLRLTMLMPRQVRNEIVNCDINYYRATGRHLRLLRPPGGRYNDMVLREARRLGYTTVDETFGVGDYRPVSADFIVARVLRYAENGAIILLHDEQGATGAALPRIIRGLRRRGYRFVTVSEMIAHLPPAMTATGDTGSTTPPAAGERRSSALRAGRQRSVRRLRAAAGGA
jgi:peptidoglycan/xylan/chitin deacetylase (PgdA/CDA1 family)